jgi:integrase
MGRRNPNNLPTFLHTDAKGQFFRKFPVRGADGIVRTKRELMGLMSRKEAIRTHQVWQASFALGKVNAQERPPVRFKQASEAFLVYSKARKRTWEGDVGKVRTMLEFFGDVQLSSFTPALAQKFLSHWQHRERKINRPLSEATLNSYIACLNTLMNQAVYNGFIDRNPIKGFKKYTLDNQRTRTLKPEEYEALLSHCSAHLKPIVEVAYKVGMRRGEILGLRWGQVVFEDNGRGYIKLGSEDTKTKTGREVPLDASLVSLLKGLRGPGADYVFTYGGKPIQEIRTTFKRACRRAGIKDFRFHDLRHCAITNMRKAGVDDATIMAISGHKTAHMFRRYNHIDMGDKQKALDKIQLFYDQSPADRFVA